VQRRLWGKGILRQILRSEKSTKRKKAVKEENAVSLPSQLRNDFCLTDRIIYLIRK
jgi:hypothetical protein